MQFEFISNADRDTQNAFFSRYLAKFSSVGLVPLYHYTNGAALIDIIKSGSLWATQAACLNDSKELLYAVEIFRDRLSIRTQAMQNAALEPLYSALDREARPAGVEEVGVFVTSFSQVSDDLSQWRAYGGRDGGYQIEFDPKMLRTESIGSRGALLPVEYNVTNQTALIEDALNHMEAHFLQGPSNGTPSKQQWADEVAIWWLWNLSFLSPLLKHPAFKSEEEWRLVFWPEKQHLTRMEFVQRRTMMSRHIPLSFSSPIKIEGFLEPYTPLLIKSVMIGPAQHREVSRVSVAQLLASRNYRVAVNLTTVPYRSHT